MPQPVEIVMDAKDANVVRTWLAITNAQQGYAQSLGLIDDAALKNAKASAEFDRANTLAMKNAQQLLDSLMTPQQKYQKNLENIASLHNRGLITVDQYLAAMKKEKAELDAQDPSVQQAIQRQKQLEAMGRQLTSSSATAADRYRAEIAKLNEIKAAGAISEDVYARSVRGAREELLKASGHVTQREKAEKALSEQLERQQRLEAVGRQLTASTSTAAERYRAEITRLNEVKAAGAISEETHTRAVREAREELLKTTGHVSKREQAEHELSEELKRNADLETQRAAIAQRVLQSIATPQQRYNQQLRELTSLRKENRLTEEQYAAAVAKSKAELDASQRSSSSWADMTTSKIAGVVTGYLSVTAAVNGIQWAIGAVMQSNEKFIRQAEEAGQKYDKLFRQFRIQAGLDAFKGEEAKKNILNIAEEAGFSEEKATSAATALVSAGVTPEEASGGSLRGFLATLNAQGLRDQDPQQFAEAITQYLNSQGMTVNAENMRMMGVQLQSLKDTKVKLTDLPQLAQIGAGMKGKLSEPEQVATFATLTDTLGSNIASTRMADIFKNLSVAGGKEDAVKELKKAGLKPTDIDFHGEDFATVMERLNTALDKLKPEQQGILLSKVIEGGNISTFRLLQEKFPLIMQRAGNLNDVAEYEKDVTTGSSGLDAAKNRQELRRNRILADKNTNGTMLRDELVQQSLERGESPASQALRGGIFDLQRFFGYGTALDDSASLVGAEFAGRAYTDQNLIGSAASVATNNPFAIMGLLQQSTRVAQESVTEASKAKAGLQERMAPSIDQQARMAPAVVPDPAMEKNNQLLQRSLDLQQQQLDEMKKRPQAPSDTRADTRPSGPVPSAANDDRNGRP